MTVATTAPTVAAVAFSEVVALDELADVPLPPKTPPPPHAARADMPPITRAIRRIFTGFMMFSFPIDRIKVIIA
jgi:hypothetical protein